MNCYTLDLNYRNIAEARLAIPVATQDTNLSCSYCEFFHGYAIYKFFIFLVVYYTRPKKLCTGSSCTKFRCAKNYNVFFLPLTNTCQ